MELSQIKKYFEDVKETGNNKFTCLCPAHDDKNPSLEVWEDTKGYIGLKCYANCQRNDILNNANLVKRDLVTKKAKDKFNKENKKINHDNNLNHHQNNNNNSNSQTIYNYNDKENKLLYQVIRMQNKQFYMRQMGKDGKWINNLYGVNKILYKLPELISAVKEGKPIYIVEGEKDVDNLLNIGLNATTNFGGASSNNSSKWLEEFNQYFTGAKDVVIIPDNDNIGYIHAINIFNNLIGFVKDIKFGVYKGNVKLKYDISDLIEDRGITNKDELYSNINFMNINEFIKHIQQNKSEFNINTDELVKNLISYELSFKFWEVDVTRNKPKIEINVIEFYNYLDSEGFYYTNDINRIKVLEAKLIRIKDKVVYETSAQDIIQFLRLQLDNLPDIIEESLTKAILLENIMKDIERLFRKEKQHFGFKNKDITYMEDSLKIGYKYFKNGFVEISTDGILFKEYKDLPHYISNKVIIDFEFELLNYNDITVRRLLKNHYFFMFLKNICSTIIGDEIVLDVKRFCALILVIGYLSDTSKTKSFSKAIYFTESNINNNANGRTGKGLIISAIRTMLNLTILNGKMLDFDYQFVFQTINSLTNLILIDDINLKFNFDNLYSTLSEDFNINKKNAEPLILNYKQSPKIVITANHPIQINGESDKGRIYIMEIFQYYNSDYTPKDDFKKDFFDDWDKNEWNIFYNLMIQIIHKFKIYFKNHNKLLCYDSETIEFNQLKLSTSNEFAEFSKNINFNENCKFSQLYNTFLNQFYLDENKYSKKRFSDNLYHYAKINGYTYKTASNRNKNDVNRVIVFEENKFVTNHKI